MDKYYGIHDKWTDIDKLNNVEIHSTDGEISQILVNGEEQGGGGSSDFSTAEVTVLNQTGKLLAFRGCLALEEDGEYSSNTSVTVMSEAVLRVIMYKGLAYCEADGIFSDATTTGNVTYSDGTITVTGNGTIKLTD